VNNNTNPSEPQNTQSSENPSVPGEKKEETDPFETVKEDQNSQTWKLSENTEQTDVYAPPPQGPPVQAYTPSSQKPTEQATLPPPVGPPVTAPVGPPVGPRVQDYTPQETGAGTPPAPPRPPGPVNVQNGNEEQRKKNTLSIAMISSILGASMLVIGMLLFIRSSGVNIRTDMALLLSGAVSFALGEIARRRNLQVTLNALTLLVWAFVSSGLWVLLHETRLLTGFDAAQTGVVGSLGTVVVACVTLGLYRNAAGAGAVVTSSMVFLTTSLRPWSVGETGILRHLDINTTVLVTIIAFGVGSIMLLASRDLLCKASQSTRSIQVFQIAAVAYASIASMSIVLEAPGHRGVSLLNIAHLNGVVLCFISLGVLWSAYTLNNKTTYSWIYPISMLPFAGGVYVAVNWENFQNLFWETRASLFPGAGTVATGQGTALLYTLIAVLLLNVLLYQIHRPGRQLYFGVTLVLGVFSLSQLDQIVAVGTEIAVYSIVTLFNLPTSSALFTWNSTLYSINGTGSILLISTLFYIVYNYLGVETKPDKNPYNLNLTLLWVTGALILNSMNLILAGFVVALFGIGTELYLARNRAETRKLPVGVGIAVTYLLFFLSPPFQSQNLSVPFLMRSGLTVGLGVGALTLCWWLLKTQKSVLNTINLLLGVVVFAVGISSLGGFTTLIYGSIVGAGMILTGLLYILSDMNSETTRKISVTMLVTQQTFIWIFMLSVSSSLGTAILGVLGSISFILYGIFRENENFFLIALLPAGVANIGLSMHLEVLDPEVFLLFPFLGVVGYSIYNIYLRNALSWPLLGLALTGYFGISFITLLQDPTVMWRSILLLITGTSMIVLGRMLSLRSPLEVGTVLTVLMIIFHVHHYLRLAPGWVLFTVLGATLLFLGATAEARIQNVKNTMQKLKELR